jgi:hypothetical protein
MSIGPSAGGDEIITLRELLAKSEAARERAEAAAAQERADRKLAEAAAAQERAELLAKSEAARERAEAAAAQERADRKLAEAAAAQERAELLAKSEAERERAEAAAVRAEAAAVRADAIATFSAVHTTLQAFAANIDWLIGTLRESASVSSSSKPSSKSPSISSSKSSSKSSPTSSSSSSSASSSSLTLSSTPPSSAKPSPGATQREWDVLQYFSIVENASASSELMEATMSFLLGKQTTTTVRSQLVALATIDRKKIREVRDVHPVAHRVVMFAWENRRQSIKGHHLYYEWHKGMEKVPGYWSSVAALARKPDMLFFAAPDSIGGSRKLTSIWQRKGRAAFEWKADATTSLRAALNELKRDAAFAMGTRLQAKMHPFFGVVSDGRTWYFVKMLAKGRSSLAIDVAVSKPFKLAEEAGVVVPLLEALLTRAADETHLESTERPDMFETHSFTFARGATMTFGDVLGVNRHAAVLAVNVRVAGGPGVAAVSGATAVEQVAVLKVAGARVESKSRLAREWESVCELKKLLLGATLEENLGFGRLHDLADETWTKFGALLYSERGLVLLEVSLYENRMQTAALMAMNRDIRGALDFLHSKSFCFVDLHAGNVICRMTNGVVSGAFLTDFESLVMIGQPIQDSPILPDLVGPRGRNIKASAEMDNANFERLLAWIKRGGGKRIPAAGDDATSSAAAVTSTATPAQEKATQSPTTPTTKTATTATKKKRRKKQRAGQ